MPRTSTLTRSRSARLPQAQTQPQLGIQSFARATKPGCSSVAEGKKDLEAKRSTLPVSPSKKRKLHELQNVDFVVREQGQGKEALQDTEENQENNNVDLLTLTPSKSLKFSSLSVSSPRSGHYVACSTSPSISPSRSTRSTRSTQDAVIREDDSVPSTPTKRVTAPAPVTQRAKTTAPSPRSCPSSRSATRPACVEEIISLHSAFLKALTIHAAHRGVAAPADLREFLPSIQRIWKKRKVVVKDLQRLLWIWRQGPGCVFRIANHGLGRVCLERAAGRTEQIDDEAKMQGRFEEAVSLLYRQASEQAEGEGEVDFLATLGLASIEESLTPFTALRKGQQRLQDLKGGVIKVKMDVLLAEAAGDEASGITPARMRDATTSRRQGLFDRIKNKELRQSKLPPPPSKEVLLRRAAAGRVEEVASVLALLRPAGYVGSGPTARTVAQRTPFCLETIVRNVQDSTRNPISEQEVEACLEILSREDVAGHWVSIVIVNQLKSVVLRSCGDVQLKDIGAKVAQLKPGWEETPKLII
ncbi:hypothetical protein AN5005.2 [Aspergillus nidulans FGSC A4]|uniref:DNA replication factor Cdt1 C-terminal domain-containing protein n=1 Tax=Emericella nidulans (strain FGSC A4 / ATCC 38163 / CBS 112.46 / NRRL 194 / M139) TaxID=227321 RepID=Q5B375_EMENI|nr:hypothetical protein [Aspergillus nidulans FGSC A4]EAA61083.1 hypothetical protein AN5005.2 [Aspergillus nidulans FGSC A4]CBF76296.1 TPA: conserved hypothetical protein [Aspergillus nidulans FGSC A4]|eukprot:XP_662609.1 hypothetical protein AN5005.2 [Aspergillus nidulans FGSC A4]